MFKSRKQATTTTIDANLARRQAIVAELRKARHGSTYALLCELRTLDAYREQVACR